MVLAELVETSRLVAKKKATLEWGLLYGFKQQQWHFGLLSPLFSHLFLCVIL